MGFSSRLLQRGTTTLLARQELLSVVFAVLTAIALVALVHAPYALLQTSLGERDGIDRIRDAQDLLSGVMHDQFSPNDHRDLAPRAARVIEPEGDRLTVPTTALDAVRSGWLAVRAHPGDETALATLGAATAELANKLSDAAQLSYDPDVDADNFGDAATYQLPKSLENAAAAAAVAHRPLAALTIGDRISIGRLMAQSEVGWAGADNDFDLGVGATTIDVAPLSRQRDAMAAAYDSLRRRLNGLADHPTAVDLKRLPAEFNAYEAASKSYLSTLDNAVDDLMQRRIEKQGFRIAFTFAWGMVVLALALIVVARVSQAMLKREQRALQREKDRAVTLENELARQRAERALVLNEAQFRTIFDGSPIGIATLDRKGTLLERNASLLSMVDDFELFDDQFDAATFGLLLQGELRPQQFEREIALEDGTTRWVDLTVFPIHITDGASVAAIAMIADVTDRRSLSEKLLYEAKHDALTGLRSRSAFLEDVRDALGESQAPDGAGRAVMLIDLDRFKIVNDTLGHAGGDDVLVAVAKRLREVVRPSDVIARLHGDEFALLVTASGEAELTAIAERAQAALRVPIVVDGQPMFIDSSVGICEIQPGVPPEQLLQYADTAMFNAKRMGRGRLAYFSGSMQEASSKWLRLASDMLPSLERGEFHVAYQPIVSLGDAAIQGFEALLRWDHCELGSISPVEFIPIAEETGAIERLGRFVLAEACRQVARWDWEHRKSQPVTMSINLSAHQLQKYIVRDVEQSLAEAGITGDRLILEITESALLESGPQTQEILGRLRATGARMSLDDFGTGYSSLRYLQQFPIDQLKIDRSFVCGEDGGLASEPIVRMLLNLAETLGLRVIAEGIESKAQNDHLIALGCRLGQGFRFSPARPPSDINLDRPLPHAMRRAALVRVVERSEAL